jgi:hypothetical protein
MNDELEEMEEWYNYHDFGYHRPVFYLKQNVSETGFCLRLRMGLTLMGQTERVSLCLRTYWAQLRSFQLKMEAESSPRNVVLFLNIRHEDGYSDSYNNS